MTWKRATWKRATWKRATWKKATWKKQAVGAVAAVLLLTPVAVAGDRYDGDEDAHPLRVVSYPIHAVGYMLEWLVARPLHALVSQPRLEPVFGHDKHPFDLGEQLMKAPAPTGQHHPG